MGIVIRLAISAVAVWVATALLPGITLGGSSTVRKVGTIVAVAIIFGVVNAVIRPIVKTVGCAFYILTLGLVALIVNGLLFLLTSWIADQLSLPFQVKGFGTAVLGALIVGVVSWILNMVVPDKAKRG